MMHISKWKINREGTSRNKNIIIKKFSKYKAEWRSSSLSYKEASLDTEKLKEMTQNNQYGTQLPDLRIVMHSAIHCSRI